ncbi:hypothetical protein JCM8547_000138 [Rhodosporidiobolus lusitaniae]
MYRFIRAARPLLKPTARAARYALPAHVRRNFWSSSSSSASSAVEATAELASSSIPAVDPSLLPLLFGVVLANAVSSSDEDEEAGLHTPPWTVKISSAGEGLGAFAARDIGMGEMLIAERPLAVWPSSLNEEQARALFEQLTGKQKEVYMALTDGGEEVRGKLDEIRVRRACNAFSLTTPGVDGVGLGKSMSFVFPTIASASNATQVMDWNTLRLELYAISPIPSSTEITIEYLPTLITLTRSERQFALKTSFGFSRCLCSVCTAPPEEVARSDARRTEIKQLVGGLRGGVTDRKKTMGTMERIRQLCEEEGVNGLPDFGDESVNSAFAVYKTLYARSQASL